MRDRVLFTVAMLLACGVLGYVAYALVTSPGSALALIPIMLILLILYTGWGVLTGRIQ